MDIPILREEDHYLLVYKPAGLLCHQTDIAAAQSDCLVKHLHNELGHPIFLVHRLDRGTSGVMLIAKNPQAASVFGHQFEQNKVEKKYLAICRGFAPNQETIDYPLYKENFFGSKSERGKRQEAISIVSRFATSVVPFQWSRSDSLRYSLVSVAPRTGRTHQIRRHLAHIRHPIIGDARHGDGKQNKMAREITGVRRLLLFANQLSFWDPWQNEKMTVQVDPDSEWLALEAALGLARP